MRVSDKPCLIQLKFALFVQILIFNRHIGHFRQEQVMTSQFFDLCHFTFNVYRTLSDSRCCNGSGWKWSQMHLCKFVHISSRTNTAVICRTHQILRNQIDHKLTGFF